MNNNELRLNQNEVRRGEPQSTPPPPQWRRPRGVAAGTWNYVHERSIADRYDAFVADSRLCALDLKMLDEILPEPAAKEPAAKEPAAKEPAAKEPMAKEPMAKEPMAKEPAAKEPMAKEPAAKEPAAKEPAAKEPAAKEPAAMEPAATHRGVVLDLGCGSGRASIALARRGFDVLAIDLSTQMLRVMMDKANASLTSGSVFPLRANLAELDGIGDDLAEHAICLFSTLGMLQGRHNRRMFLRQVARIVQPNGTLMIHVHHRWAALLEHRGLGALAKSWWDSIRYRESEFGDTIYRYRGLENMFMHRYSRRELIQDLSSSGWGRIEILPIAIDGTRIERRLRLPGGYFAVCRAQRTRADG